VVLHTRTRFKPGLRNGPAAHDIRRRRECPACGLRVTTVESLLLTAREYAKLRRRGGGDAKGA
jgi:transcriptional regulator NrdR family protein